MVETKEQKHYRKQGQTAALVIVVAGLATILAPWIVAQLGLAPRFEMLIYFAAGAAMIWSLFVTYGMWRSRQKMDKG